MANSRIMLTCRHCGGQTTLAKGDYGHYYAFEDASSALNEFFQKHMHGACVNADCYSDNARDHFVILEKGEPIADVVEVKHGKWIVPSGGIKIFEDRYVICSECNVMIPVVIELDRYWYCPKCGAKMDGKDTNVPTK